jgi:hypothetical protein
VKCVNCKGPHIASSKECESLLAIKNPTLPTDTL